MKYLLTGQESARLRFRKLELSDYDAWLPLFQQEGVARFVGLGHIETAEEQCNMWFERAFLRYENQMGGLNALIDKQTGKLVGQSGLLVQHVDGVDRLEVGYSILPDYWKQGYAIEAASRCRDFAFENEFTDSLISIIHVENFKSMKVAENNGMKFLHETIYKEFPVRIYGMSKEEWGNLRS
jgi:ribosomal-protein-alanine N-acetyltransferase